MTVKTAHLLLLLCCLAACGQLPEDVVASTRHCGGTLVRPDILMRLSSYQPKLDSPMWVVQACHPRGDCQPVVTYHHALPPAYSITPSGALRIDILGGFIEDVHRDEIKTGGVTRPVIVHHVLGKTQADLDRFRERIGLPPGSWAKDNCDPALEVRPSFSVPAGSRPETAAR